jgi:predicted RNA binding protein YcfA (HicA-like mRNA interferase family)
MHDLPAITGLQLIRLLRKDGWAPGRKARHGRAMTKRFANRTRVTFVPERSRPLAKSTLAQILGTKQTKLGRTGLLKLIDKYGL